MPTPLPSSWRTFPILLALLLGACPGDPSTHLERARELTYQRQPGAALREYEEVLSLLAKKDSQKVRGQMAPALKGAGDLCYLELKNYQRAVEYYRTLAMRYPDATETLDARANLAEILTVLGDRRSAVAELATLVQVFPNSAEADQHQYQIAKGYFDLGDYDQAALEARELQERYPTSVFADDAQMLRGAALWMLARREEAIAAFAEVDRRWPDSDLAPRARFEQAKVLGELGRDEQAVDLLVDALRTHPDPKLLQSEIARLRKRMASRRVPSNLHQTDIWPELGGAGRVQRAD